MPFLKPRKREVREAQSPSFLRALRAFAVKNQPPPVRFAACPPLATHKHWAHEKARRFILPVVLLAVPALLHAMFAMPEPVPVERLLKNTEAYLAKNPNNAQAHYTVGRIHYLAFYLQAETVPAYRATPDELPVTAADMFLGRPFDDARRQHAEELARQEFGIKEGVPNDANERVRFLQAVTKHRERLEKDGWRPEAPPTEKLIEHAEKAANAFRKAMELDKKNGLYPLGLASLLEQFSDWNSGAKAAALPPGLSGDLDVQARGLFLSAWMLAYPEDAKAKNLPIRGLSEFVSYEAGQSFLKLAQQNPKNLPANEREALPRVKTAIEKMEKLPMGAITPLVIALERHSHLDELLAPEQVVNFDLRGYGVAERWPWVKAEAGLLVWDPLDRREIRSGRQLFGCYTFQLFWATGYDALRALDDNGDGQLTGPELDGISLWFDRNGDARSTRVEVAPLATFGIRALAVDAPAFDGPHPTNPQGVTFTDGHTLPTWDWIATPAHEPAP